jgi:hypothetical protein
MSRIRALAASCSLFVACTALAPAVHANPLGVAFKASTNSNLYNKPSGMMIAGRCNRNDAAFQTARARGAEVLAYIAPTVRPDHFVCSLDTQFYMGDIGRVPLWPYPSYGQRINYANTHMTDMRPGSAWIKYVVSWVEKLMREGKVDGVFLDVVGARTWFAMAEWNSWPSWEKNAWTDGNVDLVRRLDASRRAIKPSFIIVNNGVWDRGDTRGLPGEKYVDGVNIEHPKPLNPWHVKYVGKAFGNGAHRRVMVIANTKTDAIAWSKVKGVTHVSDQTASRYAYPNPPVVSFRDLNDR